MLPRESAQEAERTVALCTTCQGLDSNPSIPCRVPTSTIRNDY